MQAKYLLMFAPLLVLSVGEAHAKAKVRMFNRTPYCASIKAISSGVWHGPTKFVSPGGKGFSETGGGDLLESAHVQIFSGTSCKDGQRGSITFQGGVAGKPRGHTTVYGTGKTNTVILEMQDGSAVAYYK